MAGAAPGGKLVLRYDDLLQIPDDGLRRELLDGDLYVTPAPSPRHQQISAEVHAVLRAYAKAHGGAALYAPLDVVFTPTDTVQPDVVYIAPDRMAIVGPRAVQGAPTLVAEVLSPTTAEIDRAEKLALYARHGVLEYWIVDPSRRSIAVHTQPSGTDYADVRELAVGERLRSATLVDLDAAIESFFAA